MVQAPSTRRRTTALTIGKPAAPPAASGDTRSEAQKLEERRREEDVVERDHQAALAILEASLGKTQGTSASTDPLLNVPKRSRYGHQTGSVDAGDRAPTPQANPAEKRSVDSSGGVSQGPPKKVKTSTGFKRAST